MAESPDSTTGGAVGFRFCPNCGTQAIEGSNFCAACGQPIVQSPHLANPKRTYGPQGAYPPPSPVITPSHGLHPTPVWWATLGGLIIVVIGVLLNWITLTVPGLTTAEVANALGSGATATGIQTDDGQLVLFLTAVAVVALVLQLMTSNRKWLTLGEIATVALVAVSIYDQFHVPNFHAVKGVGASAGIGLYVCGIAGLAVLIGIERIRREAKAQQQTAMSPPA